MLSNKKICDIMEWRGEMGVKVGDVYLNHYSGYRDKNPCIEFYSPSGKVRISIKNLWNEHNYIDIEIEGCGVERKYSYLESVPEPACSFIEKVLRRYKKYKKVREKKTRRDEKEKKTFERETQELMSGF